jgi:carboxypeptidase family protein
MAFRIWPRFLTTFAVGVLVFGSIPVNAQVTTGDVAGTVKDAQGGVIPGATVSLVSQSRGTSLDATTNETGAFIFTNVTGDTYTIRVKMAVARRSLQRVQYGGLQQRGNAASAQQPDKPDDSERPVQR